MNLLGISDFGLFCAAALLLNATPGPDTAYIVGRSVAQGRSAGVVSALGIALGICVHSLLTALGLGALLAASAGAFLAIKLAGGLYLAYLGIRMLMAPAAASRRPQSSARPLQTIFWQAALTNLLNPKVILFFVSFFPQFVQPDSTRKTAAFLLLGIVFVVMSTCWNCGTALLAGSLSRRAGGSPRLRQWLERTVGAAFVALGLKLALARS